MAPDPVETLSQWILEASHAVAFTGAGISTDSGIPDFRGPDGVWTRRDAGKAPPRWRVSPDQVRPNPSHHALAELEKLGKLAFTITQNTDNLHRESGIQHIAELHGNGRLMRCLGCDRQFTREESGWAGGTWGPGYRTDTPRAGQPACPVCKGRLISSVVNFGDPLPAKELELSRRHALQCDLMLVLGSSLVVQPAAGFVGLALRNRARVVLVNQGETPYDEAVTLRLWTGIGEVLPPAVERVKQKLAER